MALNFNGIDHVHVYAADRIAAEKWYERVMRLKRNAAFASWASEDGGPLVLEDSSGSVHIALFEKPHQPCRSTVALKVSASEFLEWKSHLSNALNRDLEISDHQLSWSLYFSDPDGNPYEITTYDYERLKILM